MNTNVVEPVHISVKGRARFRVGGLYRSRALKEYLENRLSEKEEIITISASPLTGKVLLRYNSGNTPQTIASLIEGIVTEFRQSHEGNRKGVALRLRHRDGDRRRAEPLTLAKASDSSAAKRRVKPSAEKEVQVVESWHLMEVRDVLERMKASREWGLAAEFARENLDRYGSNTLPEAHVRSQFEILAAQFKTLPVILLSAAAGLSVLTGGVIDAVVIMGVVALNGTIGFATESRAERTIQSLKGLVKPSAHVIREGREVEIGADEVVPGDILVLKPGCYVTADSRVVEAIHLSVDESALTGESMPVVKTAKPLVGENIAIAEKSNMVFAGTLITGGQGRAVVVATGKVTEIGRLHALVNEAAPPKTPLERQLRTVGNQLVILAGGVSVLVFGIGLLRGYGLVQMLRTSISLAAAAVPEGLPTVAVTTLAFGVWNMRKHHVLIRRIGAVETLGSVQTVCFDKTGTITLNRMSVVSVYAGGKRIKVQGMNFSIEDAPFDPLDFEELRGLMQVGVLCSETRLGNGENGDDNRYVLKGSPTENALVQLAFNAGMDVKQLRKSHPLLNVTHRSENRLFMSTLHESSDGDRFVALKGNPLDVLDMCEWKLKDGQRAPVTEEDRNAIQSENERMAGKALRVLGMAYAIKDKNDQELYDENGFVWLGLVGMADPIREGVRELIEVFHRAGIDAVMITGDQTPTAYAVGKRLNLSKGEQIEILDSSYLADLDLDKLEALAKRVHVFARVSPAHKLRIVQALQKAGKIVAMTGDGINDSPALKAADIGIAMGHTGTDIAREVADVVLEEDNLETLILAVRDGRTIYENIRKPVRFFLATNLSEILVTFVCITGGLGHPLNAMQLLWINTISDIFPGLALSMEAPEPDVMNRPPRDPDEPLVKGEDYKRMAFESGVITAGALGAYGYGLLRYGMGARAGTLAFQGLTLAQLLHAVSCRSRTHSIFDAEKLPTNSYLNYALGGSLVLQALSLIVPGLRAFLGLTPIGLLDAAVIGGGALLPLALNEATKKSM
jgi:P-type Ca2+ transporter type 2C